MTLATPAAPTLAGAAGGSIPSAQIVYYLITWLTAWGETVASGENHAAPGGANGSLSATIAAPPGATAGRLYFGTGSGQENQWIPISLTGATVLSSLTGGTPGFPPKRNRAYLPDTDGLIQAVELYKWLNMALTRMGQKVGGMLDQSGVFWPAGQAEAMLIGLWLEITDTWHEGWVVMPERAEFTWMKSPLQSIPGIVTTWKNGAQQVLGLWPQPGTPPSQTTLTANVGLTTDPFPVANSAGFQPPGLFSVDGEIISFTSNANVNGNNNQLGLLVRGYGGSVPATHSAGATVNELIFRFRGYRMPTLYTPGQANQVLDVPAAWDEALDKYILAKFKEYEQNRPEAKELMAEFDEDCVALRNTKPVPPGVRQVGWVAPFVGDAENLETLIGTILIP